MTTVDKHTKSKLRQAIKIRRDSLTKTSQKKASENIAKLAYQFVEMSKAKHIAVYFSFNNEISTHPLIKLLWQANFSVYLPVLHPFVKRHLLFLEYTPTTVLKKNKFRIPEPVLDVRTIIPISKLDIIFTPLLAFDKNNNRLGMGGGYYDNLLKDWPNKKFKPIGLAHKCQEVENVPIESWDVSLYKILST